MSMFCESSWLINQIRRKSPIQIFDASWYLGGSRNAIAEFNQRRIQSASFFSIDDCSSESSLPHMLPSPTQFASYLAKQQQGRPFCPDTQTVLYDQSDAYCASARLFWQFRALGYGGENIKILKGGVNAFLSESNADSDLFAEGEEDKVAAENSKSHIELPVPQSSLVASYEEVVRTTLGAADPDRRGVLMDFRPAGRFTGVDPEPREGLRGGHAPNSLSIPWADLLEQSETGNFTHFKHELKLMEVFNEAGFDVTTSKPASETVIVSCGSGVTAALGYVALQMIAPHIPVKLYDGSWAEYGLPGKGKVI